jgi:hypothetical protein
MDEERRRRFREWFAATYGDRDDARARFMADSGKRGESPLTKGRVAQLFDDGQPFGERAARSMAERFGLDPDYFLADRALSTPEQGALANLRTLRRISPETFSRLIEEIDRITAGARAAERITKTQSAPPPKDDFAPGRVRLPSDAAPPHGSGVRKSDVQKRRGALGKTRKER